MGDLRSAVSARSETLAEREAVSTRSETLAEREAGSETLAERGRLFPELPQFSHTALDAPTDLPHTLSNALNRATRRQIPEIFPKSTPLGVGRSNFKIGRGEIEHVSKGTRAPNFEI